MKRRDVLLVMSMIVILVLSLAGCGGGGIKGETIEKDEFSVTLPEGWTMEDFDKSNLVRLILDENKNQVVEIELMGNNVTAEENKALFEQQMKSYNAKFMDDVTIGGEKMMAAQFEMYDMKYTYYQGVKDGRQIAIQIVALDPKDEIVQGIMDSIKLDVKAE